MGRKPKNEVEIKEIIVEVVEVKEEPKVEKVSPFHFEFNNEGLNKLRDKLNEVIGFLNK